MSEYEELASLLDSGADPNEICFGFTLLQHAIELEGDSALQSGTAVNAALTAIVLAYGADPNFTSDGGKTALEMAQRYNHEPAIRLLNKFPGKRSAG